MEPNLYRAVTTSTSDTLELLLTPAKIGQTTGSGNTFLHLASQHGRTEAVQLILALDKALLLKENGIGELPLHLAAKSGHNKVVRALIHSAGQQDCVKMLSHGRSIDRFTALHEAVRHDHVEIVRLLIEANPEYSYPAQGFYETPLYLAARRGYCDVVSVLVEKCKSPAFTGNERATAFHAAVISNSKECLGRLLKWKPDLCEVGDNHGRTPLHYAAHYGYADLVSPLLSIPPNIKYCYAKDETGNTALHVAATQGHVSVMKKILLYCPDCWDILDGKGQTILHMAVLHNKEDVLKYILQDQDFSLIQLVNQQDKEGNTPLHLSSMSGTLVPQLISDPMVDLGVRNVCSKNALDLVLQISQPDDTSSTTKTKIAEELKNHGAKVRLPCPNKSTKRKAQKRVMELMQTRAKTQIIVTTLIATITFAAGFTIPGGYVQSGSSDKGMSVLTKSVAFQVFIVSDAMAFVISSAALSMYYVSWLHVIQKRIFYFLLVATFLDMAAIAATMVAFISGIFAVLGNNFALAVAVCVLGSCYFIVYIVLALIFMRDFFSRKIRLLTL